MQDFKCWGKKVVSMEKGKGKWQMCGREETEVKDEVWGKNAGKWIEVEIDLVGKDKFLMMEAASCYETCTEKYIKKHSIVEYTVIIPVNLYWKLYIIFHVQIHILSTVHMSSSCI